MLKTDHEFSPYLFIEHLLSARHCSESQRYNSEQKKNPSTGGHIVYWGRENVIQTKKYTIYQVVISAMNNIIGSRALG